MARRQILVTLSQPDKSILWRAGQPSASATTPPSVIAVQSLSFMDRKCWQRQARTVRLISLIELHEVRSIVWSCGHPSANAVMLTSVMQSQRRKFTVNKFGHPLAISAIPSSVMHLQLFKLTDLRECSFMPFKLISDNVSAAWGSVWMLVTIKVLLISHSRDERQWHQPSNAFALINRKHTSQIGLE